MPVSEPQETLDCASGLNLSDPSAWSRISAADRYPPPFIVSAACHASIAAGPVNTQVPWYQ